VEESIGEVYVVYGFMLFTWFTGLQVYVVYRFTWFTGLRGLRVYGFVVLKVNHVNLKT
jgi:hypothetical protein